jgi:hypothetical protein
MATKTMTGAVAPLEKPTQGIINASATGYYGSTGNEIVTEQAPAGHDFLASVCAQWEEAAQVLAERGIRVACLRFGMVLTPKGGALGKMLTPFKWGLGGTIGNGEQYYSWIAIDDLLGAIQYILSHDHLRGPINITAPEAVTNRVFTKTLSRELHRPAILPLPAFAARLAFGEMADAVLLSSCRAKPQVLLEQGYPFRYPELSQALHHLLSTSS